MCQWIIASLEIILQMNLWSPNQQNPKLRNVYHVYLYVWPWWSSHILLQIIIETYIMFYLIFQYLLFCLVHQWTWFQDFTKVHHILAHCCRSTEGKILFEFLSLSNTEMKILTSLVLYQIAIGINDSWSTYVQFPPQ